MMNQAESIRSILYKIETGSIVTYDEIMKKLSFKIARQNLSAIMRRLADEKMVTNISHGVYKKEPTLKVSLFVYGSLKRAFPNHNILDGAIYLGKARTVKKFAMFKADTGSFPRLVKSNSSKTQHIHGEIYEIHSAILLEKIDRFEGYNYQRETIKVESSTGTKVVQTYISNNTHIPKNKVLVSKWTNEKISFDKNEMIKEVELFLKDKKRGNSFA